MEPWRGRVSRRDALKWLGAAAGGAAFGGWFDASSSAALAQERADAKAIEPFTGPGPNPHWNSIGPYISEPEKAPLILLTDRPVQLETPRNYFASAFTPNDAFYVRWHLDRIPNAVDLKSWRLRIEGNVSSPQALSMADLVGKFRAETIAAVNQCSGNSRSRLQPRVPGGQWGNGAMGNARWTGVKLRDLLNAAGMKSGSLQVQLQGLEQGEGPEGMGSRSFMKSLDLDNPMIGECVVAYAMNGELMQLLNV